MARSSGRVKPPAAKGEHTIGFKELSWNLKDINDFKTKY